MPEALADLGQAVIDQLYDLLCGCDRAMGPCGDSFLTWCQPGVPFGADDFDFATGDIDARSQDGAFAFARLVDFVPEAGAPYTHDRQQRSFASGDRRLSSVYGEVLRSARVVHSGLSEHEHRKVERLAALLRSTRPVIDGATGERRQVTEDGPMLRAYNEKLAAYLAAVLRCNGVRVTAQRGAALDRDGHADRYRAGVESGMAAWISVGYRHEVDQINSYIDQVSGRDLVPWRRSLVGMLDGAVLSAGGPCRQYHHTTPVPAAFASGDGWTGHTFGRLAADAGAARRCRSWRAGGVSFALTCVDGEVEAGPGSIAVDGFDLHVELCPVLISRPWFYPPLLANRGWTCDEVLCDGGDPPAGRLVGYPSTVLFARNLRIDSAGFARAYAALAARVGDGAGIGWGPFRLGGRHRLGGREVFQHAEADPRGLSVPGLQVIGFVNHQLGKTPNPLPGLDQGRFV